MPRHHPYRTSTVRMTRRALARSDLTYRVRMHQQTAIHNVMLTLCVISWLALFIHIHNAPDDRGTYWSLLFAALFFVLSVMGMLVYRFAVAVAYCEMQQEFRANWFYSTVLMFFMLGVASFVNAGCSLVAEGQAWLHILLVIPMVGVLIWMTALGVKWTFDPME